MITPSAVAHAYKSVVKIRKRRRKFWFAVLAATEQRKLFTVEGREGNRRRNREEVLQKLNEMSGSYFKRMFRLDRPKFN